MAIPRVFVSSTCYDLKYIRENLKFFIKNMGYDPILSEDGDVFYNPIEHTHDSCISEVSSCQIFVLIIGGRYGGKFKDGEKSITNKEYEEAIRLKKPVFALIESAVYANHNVYNENCRNNPSLNAENIKYPSVDNVKIFKFIDQVRKNTKNNAIYIFNDFSDIETYLKKQWAGMMHYYITSEAETKRVSELYNSISNVTEKIEFFTRHMISSVGDDISKITIDIYDIILESKINSYFNMWEVKCSPTLLLKYETVDEYCENNIIVIGKGKTHSVFHGGPPYQLSEAAYNKLSEEYTKLRLSIIDKLNSNNISIEKYIKSTDKN